MRLETGCFENQKLVFFPNDLATPQSSKYFR